jgi:hypothetical protein
MQFDIVHAIVATAKRAKMPVRDIPIGNRAVTGTHARSGTRYESSLERDFLELVMADPSVESVEGQPVRIEYLAGTGRKLSYTPDALVTYRPDPETGAVRPPLLCEIKYRGEFRTKFAELRPKILAARAFAKARGWTFKVVTDREIRTTKFSNLRFLSAFRDRAPENAIVDRICIALDRYGVCTPFELLRAISDDQFEQAAAIPTLWWMVAHGHVYADLSAPLTMNSPLSNPNE